MYIASREGGYQTPIHATLWRKNMLMTLHYLSLSIKNMIMFYPNAFRQKTMVTSQRGRNSERGFNVIPSNGIWITCIQKSSFMMKSAAGGARY